MKLVIAEKPSVAMEIGKVLGVIQKENSCLKGNGYIISWCYGHLIGLAEPEYYNESYKKWRLEDLPIIPNNYKLIINDDTKDHFYYLKRLMNSELVDEIICATDSGREGELIFRFVYEKSECEKPVKRLWVSSLTEESIKNGFKNLKDMKTYDNLYYAGLNRAIADWLVGLNATRYFSASYGNKITVGRVQTATLNILVEREMNIKKFKKEKNYKILLVKGDFKAESKVFNSESEAREILNNIKNKEIICTDINKSKISKKTPKLYDLTLLQRECNNILGFTASQTLSIAQSLYEKKFITYPRTDSNYISDDMLEDSVYIIDKIYREFNINCEKIYEIEKIINNSKITDHHAIIPTTNICKDIFTKLNTNERNVLKIICKRLLEATHSNAIGYESKIVFKVDNIEFKSDYQYIEYYGYLEIEKIFLRDILNKNIEFEEEKLSYKFEKGQALKDFTFKLHQYFTSPPKRYTENTLLSAMENITKKDYEELDNKDYDKKGLGTPATRASIIEKLINVGYVERKDKNLVPTEKGINAINIVDEKIKSPLMTAEWEVKLQDIEKGKYDKEKFLDEIIEFTKSIVANKNINLNIKDKMTTLNEKTKSKEEKEVIGICPCCKGKVYEADKNFYCSNKECNFTMFKEDKFFKNKKVKLTKTKAKELLKNKIAEFDKLYSEKTNKFYKAKVTFEISGKYVNYKLIF